MTDAEKTHPPTGRPAPSWYDVHVPLAYHGHRRLIGVRVPAATPEFAKQVGLLLGAAITNGTYGQWVTPPLPEGKVSAQPSPCTIHPEANDQYRREIGTGHLAFCVDESGTPVLRYPGGSITLSRVADVHEALIDLVATLARMQETEAGR